MLVTTLVTGLAWSARPVPGSIVHFSTGSQSGILSNRPTTRHKSAMEQGITEDTYTEPLLFSGISDKVVRAIYCETNYMLLGRGEPRRGVAVLRRSTHSSLRRLRDRET